MNDQTGQTHCERCGRPYDFDRDDYCAACSRNLCPACMAAGCCGTTPARSGLDSDHGGENTTRIDGSPRTADQPGEQRPDDPT